MKITQLHLKSNAVAQRGFVLIAALIFMVVLTLMVVSMTNTTSSEEKIARNFRDNDIAFAAAEAALRDAELRISGAYQWPYAAAVGINAFDAVCTNGLCDSQGPQTWQPIDQVDFYAAGTGANSVVIGTTTGSPTIGGLTNAQQPRYMIELLKLNSGSLTTITYVYRITAQATGRFSNTRVVVQEVFLPF